MILEGNESVIEAIKEKKRLMDVGEDYSHLKILCICNGGLIKGAYSVGVGLALEELGFTSVFTDFVGVSSGAPSAAYFLGGNVHIGGSLIYDECCSKEFLNPWRFWSPMDINFLDAVLQGKTGKTLLMDTIFNSPTRLHIAVTDVQTAEPVLISPTNGSDLLTAIKASVLIPSMTNQSVVIERKQYMDGGFSSPHVLHHALTTIDFTHVLILTSQNFHEDKVSFVETLMNKTIFRLRSTTTGRLAIKKRKEVQQKALSELKLRSDVQHLLVWGDGSLTGSESNGKKVKVVVDRYRDWWLGIMLKN